MTDAPVPFEDLPSYDEVIQYLDKEKRKRHLLMGNGFSMSFNKRNFSYEALIRHIKDNSDDENLKHIFEKLNTFNLENLMNDLQKSKEIIQILDSNQIDLIKRISGTLKNLKQGFIKALKDIHPVYVRSISPEKSQSCFAFLKTFLSEDNDGCLFSTNYDLLLYWVIMANKSDRDEFTDGFRYFDNNELNWDSSNSANVFYLHGALHLFISRSGDVIKERYNRNSSLILSNIEKRIQDSHYPMIVTSGSANDKKRQIKSQPYLKNCYEKLSNISGSLITFGFSFGDSDYHIIEAINSAKNNQNNNEHLESIHIGVNDSEAYTNLLSRKKYFKAFSANEVHFYRATSEDIWRNNYSKQ